MHYLLFYETAPDYLERRAQFRSAHLTLAWQAHTRGELILGGALANLVDSAVLFFRGDSPDVASRFALCAERAGCALDSTTVVDDGW